MVYRSPSTGSRQLRSVYPRWDDFMALRKRFDPDDLFLSNYWRAHLSSPDEGPAQESEPGPGTWRGGRADGIRPKRRHLGAAPLARVRAAGHLQKKVRNQ